MCLEYGCRAKGGHQNHHHFLLILAVAVAALHRVCTVVALAASVLVVWVLRGSRCHLCPASLLLCYVLAFLYFRDRFHEYSEKEERTIHRYHYNLKACEASSERLGVDTIDLCYLHRPEPNTPIEETMEVLVELRNEGKIRYNGLSEGVVDERSVERMHRAHKVHPIAAYQVEFKPWTLDIETNDMLKTARELEISIVTYRRRYPCFSPENFSRMLNLLRKLESSPTKKVSVQVLAHKNDFIAIPGTKRIKYLEQNANGGKIQLSEGEVKEIHRVVDAATPPK
ncbi:NADP-dependent oxidoreductase domain-containing protein [Zychaea mexicana]|uniref:NADP-dependent oxidoreductase domain-containing protein n=1 Tax=Zychaea mexicana TaxID=64656 RepID=UPI0022FDBDBC|nr:NADP-dependent oxidoreductase domain-containing protein [Zychaea mexicana]KAI9496397.1 NADP-dependent oxidoreductase domain-containing protein [Zychaea mexicana]